MDFIYLCLKNTDLSYTWDLKDADSSRNCVIGHGVNSIIAVGGNEFYVISKFFLSIVCVIL